MRDRLNNDIRDISSENRARESKKITPFQIIMGLIIGGLLYFGYYILMTEQFDKDPFSWPYILISVYFVLATIFFAYALNRVSIWVENNKYIDLLFIPQTSVLIAYIFAPIIFIVEWIQGFNK